MAKTRHRSAPATENHVIHGWEVANAAARLALVPTALDVGRVARQLDDNSFWVCVGSGPATWRRSDPTALDFNTPAEVARAAAPVAPLAIPGAMHARAVGLRAVLRNRRLWASGAEYFTPGGYSGYFLRDAYHAAVAYPGLFNATKLREMVDFWAGSYNAGSHVVGYASSNGSTFGYNLAGSSGVAVLDSAPYFALLVALCVERGDSTVWAAHGAKVVDVLAAPTKDAAGLVWSNPAGYTIGWGFHDQVKLVGGLAMATALYAHAYARLSVLIDPTYGTQLAALKKALSTLRRSDGYYNASTATPQADVAATALIAGNALCSSGEAITSGVALASDWRSGQIAYKGALRWLRGTETWPGGICSVTVQTYQNGGYWHGEWVWWAAKAMLAAGRGTEATGILTDMVTDLVRQHRVNANGPNEWISTTATGGGLYGAATGGLAGVVGEVGPDILIDLPGAASSSALVPVGPVDIQAVEVFAPTAPATAMTIQLQSAAYTDSAVGELPSSVGSPVQVAVPLLGVATYRQVAKGIAPASIWGGYLKATALNGSATHPLVIKVRQKRITIPALVQPSTSVWLDNFAADTLASYQTNTPNWTITGGVLKQTFGVQDDCCIAPVFFTDGDVEAMVMSVNTASVYPGLVLRWTDPRNFIWVQTGSSNVAVYDVVNGTSTLLGTVAVAAVNNVPLYVKAGVRGTALSVTVTATTSGFTTTVTGKGRAGAGFRANTLAANTATWDDLTITPLEDVQRDMVSDGLTPYTRTGTWTASASRLRTSDTATSLSAIHADPTAQLDSGVDGIFTSADWAAKPAGLCVRAVSNTNLIYAVFNGSTISVYDRNGTDTLIGTTAAIASPPANGADLTMSLRVAGGRITVKVGSQYFYFQTVRAAAAGSAGAYVRNAGASAVEASYSKLRVTTYGTNLRPIPAGMVLDGGPIFSAWVTDDGYRGNMVDALVLRDDSGAALATAANANDAWLNY